MLRRHVLAALAAGVAANDDDAARAALRKIDPVARRAARKRLEASLIDAALACDAAQLTTPPTAHVQRVAALAVAGRPAADVANVAAVEAAYGALPAASMPRFPLWTVVALLAAAAMIGSVALFIATRPGPASRVYARPLPPPSADAYEKGGVPLTDPGLDTLMAEHLTDLVIEAGRARDHRDNEFSAKLDKLRAPAPLLSRGVPVTKAWDAMLSTFARSLVISQRSEGPTQREFDELRESVREVSAAFITAGLGYHLEGRFKNGYPYVQAYRVEEVVFVVTAGAPRRVLSLRRLDKLNSSWAVLGMHDEDVGDPTLHLDRIDINVATAVLPALATTAQYPLADREWLAWELGKGLAKQVADSVRREYLAALGRDANAAEKVAGLLVKRADIIDEWRDKLGRKDMYFIDTDELFVPTKLLAELEGVVPNYQRRKVIEIDNQLAELGAPRLHARIHDLVAATVRRHEAQHGFDYDRDTELKYPAALQDLLGRPYYDDGREVPVVRSARAELSAYLSQVINDPHTPHAALWSLARNAFTRSEWGTGECYAALVVLEGLGKQLGANIEGARFQRGVNRDRLAELAKLIAAQPGDKLRTAATALWTELYGEAPTTIVDAKKSVVTAAR